ncbi:MAG: polysaccharide deacetylase family protein, partial [Chryseobacterium sp.]
EKTYKVLVELSLFLEREKYSTFTIDSTIKFKIND